MIRAPQAMLAALCAVLSFSTAFGADLSVTFIDVGQGDSTLFVGTDGSSLLIDGGPARPVSIRRIMDVLDKRGVKKIDTVLITHPHLDHFGGLDALLPRVPVGQILYGTRVQAPLYEHLEKTISTQHVPYKHVSAGDKIPLGPGVDASVLFSGDDIVRLDDGDHHHTAKILNQMLIEPTLTQLSQPQFMAGPGMLMARGDHDHDDKGGVDLNNFSVVVKVTMGTQSILTTGDATASLEATLLKKPETLKSTVLKVAHHGSNYSSTADFLAVVAPKYAAISVSKDNDYGHPGPQTMNRLKAVGAQVLRTDQVGNIVAQTDGQTLTFQAMTPEKPAPAPAAEQRDMNRVAAFDRVVAAQP